MTKQNECCGEWRGKESYDCNKNGARMKEGTCDCPCHTPEPVESWTVDIVSGVEGYSLYINGRRVAGNKPWGGGSTVKSFKVSESEIKRLFASQKQKQIEDFVSMLESEKYKSGDWQTSKTQEIYNFHNKAIDDIINKLKGV